MTIIKNKDKTNLKIFNLNLQLLEEELWWELSLKHPQFAKDDDFLINPRRLRGSDFFMRWSQGRWAEEVVVEAINRSRDLVALPYGPSVIAPDDPAELETFFDRIDEIAKEGKRPDLLIYDKQTFTQISVEINGTLGSVEKVAETPSSKLRNIITKAKIALEVENSLWVTRKMPGYGKEPMKYKKGKRTGSLKFPGPVPTAIIKMEDISRLIEWEKKFKIPIYVVHIFFDYGYCIRFTEALNFLKEKLILPETQKYTNPDGTAATPKEILKVPYVLCQELGEVETPDLKPKAFIDKNGKVMTYVTFEGGKLNIKEKILNEWQNL